MRLIRVWVVRPAVVLGLLGASGWGLCIELFMSCFRGVTRQAMCIEVACMCACRVHRVRRRCRALVARIAYATRRFSVSSRRPMLAKCSCDTHVVWRVCFAWCGFCCDFRNIMRCKITVYNGSCLNTPISVMVVVRLTLAKTAGGVLSGGGGISFVCKRVLAHDKPVSFLFSCM